MGDQSGGLEPPVNIQLTQETVSDSDNRQDSVNVNNSVSDSLNPNIDFTNRYRIGDQGPYYVYVEHKTKNIGKLFPIRVGSYLYINDAYKKTITDIKTVGRNRVKVILNSRKAANELVNHELLLKNNLISYIPKFYTQRKGIVRMVDTYFSEDYLLNSIECDRAVLSVKRMTKKVTDKNTGEAKTVDRQIIIVSFLGTTLPPFLRINGVNFPVEAYRYPVILCTACLRYGHTATLCKSTSRKCRRCGESHETTDCDSDLQFCIYCKTNEHSSVSKLCPHFLKQKRIKAIMAEQNLSFKEAESIEKNPSYAKVVTNNRFNLLQNLSNFPQLPLPQNYNHVVNNLTNSQPVIHPPKNRYQQKQIQTQPRERPVANKRKTPPSLIDKSAKKTPISQSSPAITSNPYRTDFTDYKNKLTEQLTFFVSNLISQIHSADRELTIDLEQLNIKQQIVTLLSDISIDKNDDNDDSDEDSSY